MKSHTSRSKVMRAETRVQPTLFDSITGVLDEYGIEYTVSSTPHLLNFILSMIGIVGVWITTHNVIAILFTVVAALHFEFKIKKNTRKESHGTR